MIPIQAKGFRIPQDFRKVTLLKSLTRLRRDIKKELITLM
jgi:hypothetical protein